MAILIVDDQEETHQVLKVLLSKESYGDLLFADCPAQAYTYLGLNGSPMSPEDIEMILMDMDLDGVCGVEVTRDILSQPSCHHIPVIFITGDTSEGSLGKAFGAGAVDYINKPFKKTELLARINSALRLKREIDLRREREHEKENLIQKLELALAEIHSLRGILPVCCVCKRVRDDQGYWDQVDEFLAKQKDIEVSHSLCPDCLEKESPEIYQRLKLEGKL